MARSQFTDDKNITNFSTTLNTNKSRVQKGRFYNMNQTSNLLVLHTKFFTP